MTIVCSYIWGNHRRGFTLIEALMASAILASAVIAVTWAITAGQQQAFEAQQHIAGTLLAEKRIGELASVPYDELTSGLEFGEQFCVVMNEAEVLHDLPGLDVRVRGKQMTVSVVSLDGLKQFAETAQFFPESGP